LLPARALSPSTTTRHQTSMAIYLPSCLQSNPPHTVSASTQHAKKRGPLVDYDNDVDAQQQRFY
jgi:hypothetical protein